MTHPVLMPRDDGRYELVARYHEVPAGFVTDGASIPRLLWRVLGHPFEADIIGAAVRHSRRFPSTALSSMRTGLGRLRGSSGRTA